MWLAGLEGQLTAGWRAARVAAGLAIGGGALWLAARGVDVVELRRALATANVGWTLLAIVSVFVTVAAGVARWRMLFYPDAHERSWSTLTAAFVVGQMLNIVLPLRLGEIVRAGWVSRAERIPVAQVVGTIAVERLADLVAMGATVAALLVLTAVPAFLTTPGRALIGIGAVAAAFVALLAWRGGMLGAAGGRISRRLPHAVGSRLERTLTSAIDGTRILQHRTATAWAGMASLLVLLLAASTNYLLFVAFDLSVPAAAAVILLVALQLGNTLVSVPGNVGVFHYVTVLTLGAYSVEAGAAFAYAVLLHLVALLPKVVAGASLLALSRRQTA